MLNQNFLGFLTAVLGFIGVGLTFPQVITLYKHKDSRGFNLLSWVSWGIYQFTAIFYSISIGSAVFIAINVGWTLFYAAMIPLIIVYRHPSKHKKRRRK